MKERTHEPANAEVCLIIEVQSVPSSERDPGHISVEVSHFFLELEPFA